MVRSERLTQDIDWVTVLLYLICLLAGWANIYAAVYNPETHVSILDFSINSGKQLMWIGSSVLLIVAIMVIDYKFYDFFAYLIYGLLLASLVGVMLFARNINGQNAWFEIGSLRIQPSEFAKFATALALAKYLGQRGVKFSEPRTRLIALGIIALPALLILLQNDTGSALVFGSFVLVLYREGLSPWILIAGVAGVAVLMLSLVFPPLYLVGGLVLAGGALILSFRRKTWGRIRWVVVGVALVSVMIFGVQYAFEKVLQPHQQARIRVLIDPEKYARKEGYNVIQSKIAIGSGGWLGKGFLQGTQTKFDFVPEQSTDFIFCTIGEEHGWLGGMVVIALMIGLLWRLTFLAERQKDRFARIYGYSVASILFFHFAVNIGMTIGLMPVIGIPLPFFSYGGSSLWSFTVLLFIFLKLDSHRMQILTH
jgi:rod shape determining protein RodA